MIHALITNDDGIDAPGIAVLATAALEAGMEVTMAAPGWDASGAAASFTAVEYDDGGISAVPRSLPTVEAAAYAMDASPAYIVRAAVAGALGRPPDIVLSGVNLGANTGHAILHSGTVGAALTASTLGLPALAASLDITEEGDADWSGAASVLRDVLPLVTGFGPEVGVLNLNVPAVAEGELEELRIATLAPFGAVQVTNTHRAGDCVKLTYHPRDDEPPEGTDVWFLRRGHPTVTAIGPVCETGGDLTPLLPVAVSG